MASMREADCLDGGSEPLCHSKRVVMAGIGQHDDELLASAAEAGVPVSEVLPEQPGNRAQGVVAGFLAAGMVERGEAVEVQEQHPVRLPRLGSDVIARRECIIHGTAVGEAGEGVGTRLVGELLVEGLQRLDGN